MRIFVAALGTETNTFAPLPIDRRAFTVFAPGEHPRTPTPWAAPVVAAREAAALGHTVIEGSAAWADPAGMVGRAAYESLRDEILAQLRAALPVDIALFGLHGAMVADGYDDCEGDILSRARAIVGSKAVVGTEIDPHAHFSETMLHSADLVVAFKEFPHTDFLARARDLVRLSLAQAEGRVRLAPALFDMRAIGGFMTSREPGRSFVDRILGMEGRDGILSISPIHGFPAADVYDVGSKMLVYADGDAAKAAALAEQLGREVLAWGRAGVPKHFRTEEAVEEALRMPGQPIILADRWDNPGGGVAGDSTFLLEALMKRPEVPSALGALWDPQAAEFCRAAGPGATLELRIGGKANAGSGRPVDTALTVRATTEDLRIPFEQAEVSLGAAASVTINGHLDLVLATGRAQTFSPAVFTKLGIDLSAKKIVVVKSSNHFHAAFAPIAAGVLYVDCGGPYPPDPAKIPYRKIRRPIAPLDANPLLG